MFNIEEEIRNKKNKIALLREEINKNINSEADKEFQQLKKNINNDIRCIEDLNEYDFACYKKDGLLAYIKYQVCLVKELDELNQLNIRLLTYKTYELYDRTAKVKYQPSPDVEKIFKDFVRCKKINNSINEFLY